MPSSEIIEALLNSNSNAEEDEEEEENISHNEVIDNINIILRFINQSKNDVKVDGSFIQRLCRFKNA